MADIEHAFSVLSFKDNNSAASELITNITDDMSSMNISGDTSSQTEEHFRRYSGVFGFPNKHCETFDDEDLIYRKLVLPNVIIDELIANDITTYREYLETFCMNMDECFIKLDTAIELASVFDDIFAQRMINFEYINELSCRIHLELMDILNENNWLNDYFSIYIQDLIYAISIIGETLDIQITYFDTDNYPFMIRLLNNLCVIIIYLKIYFESNILNSGNLSEEELKIVFI